MLSILPLLVSPLLGNGVELTAVTKKRKLGESVPEWGREALIHCFSQEQEDGFLQESYILGLS